MKDRFITPFHEKRFYQKTQTTATTLFMTKKNLVLLVVFLCTVVTARYQHQRKVLGVIHRSSLKRIPCLTLEERKQKIHRTKKK